MWRLIEDPEAPDGCRRVAMAAMAGGVWVGFRGGAAFIVAPVADAAVRPQAAAARPSVRGLQAVRAPMVGRVVEVLSAPGRACRAGDALVVLEAMKMEYRLTAPADGRVEAVLCQAGDLVELDAVVAQVRSGPLADAKV